MNWGLQRPDWEGGHTETVSTWGLKRLDQLDIFPLLLSLQLLAQVQVGVSASPLQHGYGREGGVSERGAELLPAEPGGVPLHAQPRARLGQQRLDRPV